MYVRTVSKVSKLNLRGARVTVNPYQQENGLGMVAFYVNQLDTHDLPTVLLMLQLSPREADGLIAQLQKATETAHNICEAAGEKSR